jgi:type III pantothenate kinase
MLLVTDVGNTRIKIGIFEGEKLRATWNIATDIHRLVDEHAAIMFFLLGHEGLKVSDIRGVSMCSVVPPLTPVFQELFQHYFNTKPLVIEAGVKTGVAIRMDNPREVGSDRIVNAAAAHHLYRGPAIIIDTGTATTFDVVSAEGEYLGGAIAPGINTAAEALYERTSALPRVELVRPKKAIGTNTVAAMQSGIVFGYVGLIEGIVAHIQAELPKKALVVATGGDSELLAKETRVIDKVNLQLILTGLKVIYEMNESEAKGVK